MQLPRDNWENKLRELPSETSLTAVPGYNSLSLSPRGTIENDFGTIGGVATFARSGRKEAGETLCSGLCILSESRNR